MVWRSVQFLCDWSQGFGDFQQIQWKPLNIITDNVIIWLMWSKWPSPNPKYKFSTLTNLFIVINTSDIFISLFPIIRLYRKKQHIYYIKMKVCVCVCMCVRQPAAGPTQAITSKFGMGSSFHPGSAPSQGATPDVDPWGTPYSDPIWKTLKGK